jgi:cytochrome c oxidase cbb3-type subunit 2
VNQGPLIFLGVFFALATSWFGLVLMPQLEMGGQQPEKADLLTRLDTRENWKLRQSGQVVKDEGFGPVYPATPPGTAQQGAEIYRANGCVACHTRQVRGNAADLQRWGSRRTVGQDYLYDYPVLLGSQRIGPDLANIGLRPRTEEWHLLHLYQPQMLVPGSTMPPYRFLFEKRKIGRQPSPESLKLSGKFAPEAGYEIVPKPAARTLVAFLVNQRIDTPLFEAPMPTTATNATTEASVTNAAPAAAANPPAK